MSLFITDLILPHQTNKPGSRPELKPLEKKMLLNKASMKVDVECSNVTRASISVRQPA